ncbi:uncharacterized protein [Mytilus edulis]|uniref:uncharacterized protein n=1 Tax=Mytilus edulis TaxID=6550 RepID=UPI0039F1248E
MKSIQMILAVFLIAALCGKVTSKDTDYGNGYCTNTDCQTGYDYYDNSGYCRYGDKAEVYKYNCKSHAGCCLPRYPDGQMKPYCTTKYGCPKQYYFYNNYGYYFYDYKNYYDCRYYKGCCIRREY